MRKAFRGTDGGGFRRQSIAKICPDCKKAFGTVWPRQVYCKSCGAKRRVDHGKKEGAAKRSTRSAGIREIHDTTAKPIIRTEDAFARPVYAWSITYRVPFSLDASKNRRWSLNGQGTMRLTESVREYSDMIGMLTKQAMAGQAVAQNKLWLSFHVEKENHRADAVNVVDTLCDAIKDVIGLDDNWFCLDQVDWTIRKVNPEIIIRIGQTTLADAIVCSHCGEVYPAAPEIFTRKKGAPLGLDRVCKNCRTILARHARSKRKDMQ